MAAPPSGASNMARSRDGAIWVSVLLPTNCYKGPSMLQPWTASSLARDAYVAMCSSLPAVGDDDGDDLPPSEVNPRPRRVPEQELLSSEFGFLTAAELCAFLENISGSFRFRSGATYTRKNIRRQRPRARGAL